MQHLTKDKSTNTELYVSDKSLALATDPNAEISKLKQNLSDVGLAAHVEILENLPTSHGKTVTKTVNGKEVTVQVREDGSEKSALENAIDATIGKALDTVSEKTPFGLLPSKKNDGGYITQIATQLFGDNRAGIVVHDKSKLEALHTVDGKKLRERQPGDKPTDWDYEKIELVQTKDGIKPISEVDNPEGLKHIVIYRTNPDKQLVIEDGKNRSGNPALEDHKIRISADDIKQSGIDHVFTNGMFNSHETAVWNQQTQQGFADGILNYNQQHGIVGDLLEDIQDHVTSNLGLNQLGTGGSRQTGELISQMTTITNGNLVVGAHSQGTMMTQNGLGQHKQSIAEELKNNSDAKFLIQYSGAPVNHNVAENLVKELYGGEEGIKKHIGKKDASIDDVFRSNVTPQDAVGTILGFQSAGINNSENLGRNILESIPSIPRLFGFGDPSPHSYYPCVIGCGNENFTPDIKKYYTPNKLDEKGKPQSPMRDYYKENFEVTRPNGQKVMTIDLDLLPKDQAEHNKVNLDEMVTKKDHR